MKSRRMLLLAGLGMVLGLSLIAVPAQATIYIQGCLQQGQTATLRQDTFDGDTIGLAAWDTSDAKYRLVGYTRYYFCFDNNGPNRLQPDSVKFCATKLNAQDPWSGTYLRKFVFNPYYFTFDGENTVDPGSYFLNWDGIGHEGDQKCTPWQGIPAAATDWLRQDNRPAYTVTGHADIANSPDRDIEFTDSTTSRGHLFSPSNDPIIAS